MARKDTNTAREIAASERIGFKLVSAVTEYDRREEARAHAARAKGKHGYHNIYALPQYIEAVNSALTYATPRGEIGPDGEPGRGMTLRAALCKAFNGRLLDACLEAVGEPVCGRTGKGSER